MDEQVVSRLGSVAATPMHPSYPDRYRRPSASSQHIPPPPRFSRPRLQPLRPFPKMSSRQKCRVSKRRRRGRGQCDLCDIVHQCRFAPPYGPFNFSSPPTMPGHIHTTVRRQRAAALSLEIEKVRREMRECEAASRELDDLEERYW